MGRFSASVKNGRVVLTRKAAASPKPAVKAEPPVDEPVDAPRAKAPEKK